MTKKQISIIASLVVISGLTIFGFGQGCAKFSAGGTSGGSGGATALEGGQSAMDSDYIVYPETASIGLAYSKQVKDNYVSCLGTQMASDLANSVYNSRKGSITVRGTIESLTAPMLVSLTAISGEICKDLLDQEENQVSKRIFTDIDLKSNSLPGSVEIDNAARRIALSCWSRNPEEAELTLLRNSVVTNFGGAIAEKSKSAMLFMCTAMLAATDGIIIE